MRDFYDGVVSRKSGVEPQKQGDFARFWSLLEGKIAVI
jgi:hypothetical protein